MISGDSGLIGGNNNKTFGFLFIVLWIKDVLSRSYSSLLNISLILENSFDDDFF
jgi:hypothetical protein